MKKYLLLASASLVLSACITDMQDLPTLKFPKTWGVSSYSGAKINENEKSLKAWWKNFNDPVLNTLIERTLDGSPDRKIAQARILEARGLLRSARSFQFPQIGFSGNKNRQDFGFVRPGEFFEAGFDATYELDVFGRVRNSINAEEQRLEALEAQYHDVTLSLIAEVARSYVYYRAAIKQIAIAQKNLEIQAETLTLIKQQQEFGEAPQLDVERSENLVNTTKASIPEFKRMADNYRLQLSVLTGDLPEILQPILEPPSDIIGASITPALIAPAKVLSLRPDIRAASSNLAANTSLTKTAISDLFPSFTLEGFFGYTEGPFASTTSIWRIAIGTAVNLIDFGRIEGAIDAAKAREIQAYELMKKTLLEAVVEVETAITDVAQINEQRASLQNAFDNAEKSFALSEILYKEGEISFLDILDTQRTVNDADSALIRAEAAHAESLIRLYKALGVY